MERRFGFVIALAPAFSAPATANEMVPDHTEMAAMFAADQSQRMADTDDHEAAARADEQRRIRTRELF